jgi:hypothetical protein
MPQGYVNPCGRATLARRSVHREGLQTDPGKFIWRRARRAVFVPAFPRLCALGPIGRDTFREHYGTLYPQAVAIRSGALVQKITVTARLVIDFPGNLRLALQLW